MLALQRLTVTNHKGGVGKTAISTNLARQFVRADKRVVFIDFDVQGDATGCLKSLAGDVHLPCCVDLFTRELTAQEADLINAQSFYLAASTPELAAADDLEPAAAIRMMNRNLAKLNYDLAVMDTSPTLSRQSLIAAGISKDVLIPVKPSQMVLRGAVNFLKILINERTKLRARGIECNAVIMGLVVNLMENNKPRQIRLLEEMKQEYGNYVLNSVLCNRDAFAAALDAGIDVHEIGTDAAVKAKAEIDALYNEVKEKLHD